MQVLLSKLSLEHCDLGSSLDVDEMLSELLRPRLEVPASSRIKSLFLRMLSVEFSKSIFSNGIKNSDSRPPSCR